MVGSKAQSMRCGAVQGCASAALCLWEGREVKLGGFTEALEMTVVDIKRELVTRRKAWTGGS